MTDDPLRDPHVPVLIVTGSAQDGSSLVLDSQGFEKILGSGPDCHLRVEGGNVDYHHARILWDERGVVLSDEGSSTGTYVNGERIGSDHPLEDGDRICLGPPGSRNTVKMLMRVPAEIAEAQTIGFSAPSLEAPFVLDHSEPTLAEPEEPILLAPEPEAPAPPADEVFFVDEAPPAQTLPVQPARNEPVAPAPPPPLPTPVAAAPAPSAASPPPLPSIAERPRPRPDYAPELPSIAPDRTALERTAYEEEAGDVVPEAPLKRLGKKRAASAPRAPSGPPSRVVMAAGAGVLVLALVGGGVWWLRGRAGDAPATGGGAGLTEDQGPPGALRITALEPEVALPGTAVALQGANLPAQGITVTVAGVPATVEGNANGRVRFRVPKLPVVVEGQSVPVVVKAGASASRPFDLFLGRLPLVTELNPLSGVPGDRVVVKGRGFDPAVGGNQVAFGEDPALILSASASELAVVVPAPRSALNRVDAPVVVTRGGSSSSDTVVFNITRPSAGVYRLKFFGAAVEGDRRGEHALVATEAGPLLLLSGRATAASVGERATSLANALNMLVGQDPRFEARGAAVTVAGRPDPIVTVTSYDAVGYSKPLDPVMGGPVPGLAAVATYWAAVLQDTFVLFGKAERPSRVLELSPRGKVLMDLYSEAERRLGRGAGVPTSLVSPPTWTVAKAFREMALALPTRGGAVAAAAVAGRWQGTMQEAGSPPRPLSLELRLEGSSLVGTMSTNVGGIAMNTPLRDVSYVNGVLAFTLAGGQAPRRVQGRVNGAQLEGVIQAVAGAPAGRVSLRYLE